MPRPNVIVSCLGCGTEGRPIGREVPFCSSRCRLLSARRGIFLTNDSVRFDAKTERVGSCLLFRGDLNHAGYGTFYVGVYGMRAHHFAWIRAHGPIPDELDVLHNCPGGDNPACVEDAHLWLGTHQQNMADMVSKGRSASGDRNAMHARPEIRAVGERASGSKLTDAQVLEARRLYQPGRYGFGSVALAKKYGISPQSMIALLNRKTWRHI